MEPNVGYPDGGHRHPLQKLVRHPLSALCSLLCVMCCSCVRCCGVMWFWREVGWTIKEGKEFCLPLASVPDQTTNATPAKDTMDDVVHDVRTLGLAQGWNRQMILAFLEVRARKPNTSHISHHTSHITHLSSLISLFAELWRNGLLGAPAQHSWAC